MLLYVALWGVGTGILLQIKTDIEHGVGAYSPLPPADLDAYDLPFAGVNVALEQYENEAERLRRLEALGQLGFGWVRQRFDWGKIEPVPGEYRWDQSDAIMRSIRAAGLTPIIVLDGSPAWAQATSDNIDGGNPLAPPANPNDFAQFAAAIAARYGDSVRFYQIWDEPNIWPHWGNRWVNPVEYAQLLKLASTAIRNADPNAVILLGALAPTADRGHLGIDEVYFLQRLYAAGAQRYFDAVAVQPFGFGYTPEDPTQRLDTLNFHRALLIRRAMVAAGDATTPMVIVRFGWNRRPYSPWGAVPRDLQSDFTERALTIAYTQWPWLAGMAWAIDRPPAPPTDPAWGFSINDELTQTFARWNKHVAPREAVTTTPPRPDWLRWTALVAAMAMVAWRLSAALRILPWREWQSAYRELSPLTRAAVWAALLIAYYLAASPPLIVLCGIAAAVLIIFQPSAGIWLAAAVTPFYFQHKELHWGSISLTVAPAIAASLCLAPALLVRTPRERRAFDRWDALAVGWLAVIAVSAAGVWRWPAYSRGVLELAISPLILFWTIRAFTHGGQDRRRILTALVFGGTLAAIFGITGWLRGGGTEADSVRRLVGPYFSANHMALYLERTFFLALGLALFYRPRTRWRYTLTAMIMAVALILTASRGAILLALPAGFLVLGFYVAKHRTADVGAGRPSRSIWIAGALLAMLFGAALIFSWSRLNNSATLLARWHLWRNAADLWRDYWLTGVGPGGFFWRFPAYIPVGSALDPNLQHPHNLWLEFAATGGVLALIWLVGAIVVVVQAIFLALQKNETKPNWPAVGLLAALAAALAHAQVDAFAALPDLAAWNWMAMGVLAAGLSQERKRSRIRHKEKPP